MTTRPRKPSRLTEELLEMVDDMHRSGVMDDATHAKIAARHLEDAETPMAAPISGDEIRAIREKAKMSQAAFAKYLNSTVDYISRLEREIRGRPGRRSPCST